MLRYGKSVTKTITPSLRISLKSWFFLAKLGKCMQKRKTVRRCTEHWKWKKHTGNKQKHTIKNIAIKIKTLLVTAVRLFQLECKLRKFLLNVCGDVGSHSKRYTKMMSIRRFFIVKKWSMSFRFRWRHQCFRYFWTTALPFEMLQI